MLVDYKSLSDQAKVWIYPSSRKFYSNEITLLIQKIETFMSQWKQDEKSKVSYQFLYDRFIIFLAEEDVFVSSQDIDSQVFFVLGLQKEYQVELLDKMNVCFKQGAFVQYKEIKEFKKLLKNKSVSNKTVVFDNLIQNKYDFEHYWEIPITESWYNRFL